ncbi:hypothetical protein ACLOJK_033476 [Asimina triloba]
MRIEIKPGKPYTHEYDEAHGRLHISQAVLGSGPGTKRCIVSCSVGEGNPVFICSLLPDKTESCPLQLEFEEEDEVVFSVDGPRSVHLTGYYLGPSGGFDQEDDDADSYGVDLSEAETDDSTDYDNEDEYDVDFVDDSDFEIFPSSAQPTSGVRIEEIMDDEKAENGNSTKKYTKKVNQLSEPDEEDDDDDDDGSQHQIVVRGTGGQVVESEDEDGFPLLLTSKSKATSMNVNASKNSDAKETLASKKEKEKKKKKKKQEDTNDQVTGLKRKVDAIDEDGEPESGPKELSHGSEASGGATAEKGRKPKKKKKEKVEKKITQVIGSNIETSKTIGDQNGVIDDKKLVASHVEKPQSGDVRTDRMDHDAAVEDHQEEGLPDDANPAVNAATDEISAKKKKKKKNKKSKAPENDATGAIGQESGPYKSMTNVEENPSKENDKVEVQLSKARTFSNGLVIEEISMGKPDGKRASPGNRVSVHYIGRLKKNGQMFDSNIGKRPFSYGPKGAGKIPPNSWLVFDVELVEVM